MKATFICLFTHELPYGDIDKKKQWELGFNEILTKVNRTQIEF